MTAREAPGTEPDSANGAVLLDRVDQILRAARMEAARGADKRRNHELVRADELHEPGSGERGRVDHEVAPSRSAADASSQFASCWLRRAAAGRAITTRSRLIGS